MRAIFILCSQIKVTNVLQLVTSCIEYAFSRHNNQKKCKEFMQKPCNITENSVK